jgi:hypothetical protein
MSEPTDETLRDWLLHRLPDAQAHALEARLLLDDAFGARLRAVETDLIDDYARGRLDEAARAAVERWLLATPADRERLQAALALASVVAPRAPAAPVRSAPANARPSRRRVHGLALAAAAAVLLVVLGRHLREPARTPPLAGAPTVTLLANLQRGSGAQPDVSARVPAAAPAVRLQVEVASAARDARYALHVERGAREVFGARALAARHEGAYRFVEVALPSGLLAGGDYAVRLADDATGDTLQEWTLRVRAE